MRLLVFGASGPTGREIVSQSLAQGHEVTAFARRPEGIPPRERLRVVQGDTMRDPQSVAEAVRGQDAAVSALGMGKVLFPNGMMERSIRNIVPAMERAGVKRFVLMSAFGVGESGKDAPLLPRLTHVTLLSALFADKARAEEDLRQSSLDWTIVYPVMLTGGPMTGSYRAAERLDLMGLPTISRADVAQFMLAQLAAPAHVRRSAVISY